MNTRSLFTIAIASAVLVGCNHTPPCEDILEVNRQMAMCEGLAETMTDNRYPQQALSARKRYESECENFRYYRDEYDTICKSDRVGIGAPDRVQRDD